MSSAVVGWEGEGVLPEPPLISEPPVKHGFEVLKLLWCGGPHQEPDPALALSHSILVAFVINTEVGCSLCRASVMPKPPAIWSLLKMLQVVSQCTQTQKVSYAATILSAGLRRDE